jgi:hypothetical protein
MWRVWMVLLSLSPFPCPIHLFEIDFAVAEQGSRCDIKNITYIIWSPIEDLISLFVTLWGLCKDYGHLKLSNMSCLLRKS